MVVEKLLTISLSSSVVSTIAISTAANLLGHLCRCLHRHGVTALSGDILAALPWHLDWHLLAVLSRHLVAALHRFTDRYNHTGLLWYTRALRMTISRAPLATVST